MGLHERGYYKRHASCPRESKYLVPNLISPPPVCTLKTQSLRCFGNTQHTAWASGAHELKLLPRLRHALVEQFFAQPSAAAIAPLATNLARRASRLPHLEALNVTANVRLRLHKVPFVKLRQRVHLYEKCPRGAAEAAKQLRCKK